MASERALSLRSTYMQILGEEEFHGREEFESGMLPTEKQVSNIIILCALFV